jgi:hypothetical protein
MQRHGLRGHTDPASSPPPPDGGDAAQRDPRDPTRAEGGQARLDTSETPQTPAPLQTLNDDATGSFRVVTETST